MALSAQVMPLNTGLSSDRCLANYNDFISWFLSRGLVAIDLNIGPYFISIIFSVALLVCMKRQVCSVANNLSSSWAGVGIYEN